MNREALAAQLEIDEKRCKKPYRDSVGKLSIGIGRNLDDVGLSDDEINYLLNNDIIRVEGELDHHMPWWRRMSEARQGVLANMCFNMGLDTLCQFKNTLAAMQSGDYERAAQGMENSKWAGQVGDRAKRLIAIMRKGS